jgi:hypothetical protein
MNRLKKLFVIVTILMFTAASQFCSNNDGVITKDTYGIILKGYTAMRIDPMIFAGIISELNKGTSVQVLEKSKEKSWVGKTSGYWYKVKTNGGISGWVFGQNISIHFSKSKDSIDKVVSDFMTGERIQVKQYLAGKWWSINEFGDFTDHCLELYESGKYRSYLKGDEKLPIAGTYRIDFNKNEILFSDGTSFKSNLELAKRGVDYIMKKNMKDHELRFKKISVETSPEPEIKSTGAKKPSAAGNGNTAQ